jgi:hypothetical protein
MLEFHFTFLFGGSKGIEEASEILGVLINL